MERLKPVEALTLMAASVFTPVAGPTVGHVGGRGERFAAASRLGPGQGWPWRGPWSSRDTALGLFQGAPSSPASLGQRPGGPGLRLPSASYHTLWGKDH